MRSFFNTKLLYQVVFAIAICSILLSMSVGLVLIRNSTLYVTEEVKAKYNYLVSDYTHQVDIRIKEAETLVNSFDIHLSLEADYGKVFSSPTANYLFYEKYQRSLDEAAKVNDYTYDLFIYLQSEKRDQDMVLTSYGAPSEAIHDETREIASNAILEDYYNSNGFWLGFEDKNLFCYLNPIIVDDEVIGFVGGRFRVFSFVWGVDNITRDIDSDLILYDHGYEPLVLNHSLPGKLISDIRPIKTKIDNDSAGIFEFKDSEKRNLIIGYSRLSNGWLMVLEMTKKDVLVRTYELIKLMIMLLIIGGVFSLFIAVSMSSRLTEPIADLANEMRRIGSGDYNTQLSEEYMIYNNEIGILATTVETMRFSLSRYIKEIEDNSKNLEALVENRTSELVTTNEYLEQSLAEIEEKKAELILVNDELEQTLENLRGTQEQLIESRKLSALNDMVNGVAHQLNTPIGVSITAVSYLKKELNDFYRELKRSGLLNEDNKESLRDIAETTQLAMKNLTKARDTLDTFKYITADSSSETAKDLDLCEFFEDLTAALMVKAEYVKYNLDFACDSEIMVKSYPSVLTQIMSNLIANSIGHGFKNRDHGNITVRLSEQEHYVVIDYRDDGVGIAEENVERIFDPFFTTKQGKDRIGLGLSIVYNYVTVKLKGRIRCESGLSKGTHFVIHISK